MRPASSLLKLIGPAMACAVLAAASTARAALPDGPPLLPGRPADSRVAAPDVYGALQRRIDAQLNAAGADCVYAYDSHKAQAWLNFAEYAHHEALPDAVAARALGDADRIVATLEGHGEPPLTADELPGARHVRDDLWRAAAAVRQDGRFCGAPKLAAFCEVQLAWAGYEASVGGWRHVDPYIRIAEDYCTAAQAAKPAPIPDHSAPKEPVAPPPVEPPPAALLPVPLPAATMPAIAPPAAPITLAVSVNFAHDRSARADIRAPGRSQLRRFAKKLRDLPATYPILIVGHADHTGKRDYNLALSARRAETVAAALESLGIERARLIVRAVGSDEPVVKCRPVMRIRHRKRYLTCLEPNRRVSVQLQTEAVADAMEPNPAARAIPTSNFW